MAHNLPTTTLILHESQRLILRHGFAKVTMKDIAEACGISRPTLYKSFVSKEAILAALVHEGMQASLRESEDLLRKKGSLKSKLESFFDIWTIKSAAIAIDSASGKDILMNVATYVPKSVDEHYQAFETALAALLKGESKKRGALSAEDLAHILTMASKGLKASTADIKDLKRMIAGLIAITVAALD